VLLGTAGALFALTVATVITSKIQLGAFNIVLALAIAGLKATLVALFFMHLRWEGRMQAVAIAAAVFFVVVGPMNKLIALRKKEGPLDPTTKQCPECLSEVPLAARRCMYCTSQLAAVA
jgi:caa(3)-type oxidase subunit IV